MIENGILINKVVDGVKYGITHHEIAQVIGVASTDIGRLCTSKHVNKWSKYKPVRSTLRRSLTDDHYKNYKEGSVSKPYGLLMPVPWIGPYDAGLQAAGEQTDPDALNRASVWEYAQPEEDETTHKTKYGYRCRAADFNGYAHGAEALFTVRWIDNTARGEGIRATVTLGSREGGLSLADMGLAGCYLSLIVMSESEYAIAETGGTGRRYLIGGMDWNTHPLNDTTRTYEFSMNELYLSQVLDNMMLFLVVTDVKLTYGLYCESYKDGVAVNPDGWTKYNAVFFPKMTATATKRVMLEGSARRLMMNGGIGNILWANDNFGTSAAGDSKNYASLVYDGDCPVKGNYIELASLDNGFDVKITELGYTESRSARRKFSISGAGGQLHTCYLNNIAYTLAPPTVATVMYKPLLCDVGVKGDAYRSVSFYIRYELQPSVYDATASIVARYVSLSGNTKELVMESGKWNVFDAFNDTNRYMYHSISFANVVNARNEVDGFVMKVTYGLMSDVALTNPRYLTVDSWLQEGDILCHPLFPTVVGGEDGEVKHYGDIHIRLPEGMSAGDESVTAGRIGRMKASFEVIDADTPSSIGAV